MCQRITFVILAAFIVAIPQAAFAQADANKASVAGKEAFSRGEFEKARDSFLVASKTDNKNPEVFLWLGKSHYQLGQLDKAIAAWRTTLRLAPDEPYATRMLKALQGELGEAEAQIALIEVLVKERLFAASLAQCKSTLAEKGLSDAQRAKAMTLKAEALLGIGRTGDAISVVHEAMKRFGTQADVAKTTLLLGRAKMKQGGRAVDEGLVLLKKVISDHAGTPEATTAEYTVIEWRIDEDLTESAAAALGKWIAAHGDHDFAVTAQRRLIDAYLTLARRLAPKKDDAKLSGYELSAIGVATGMIGKTVRAAEASAITANILAHVNKRYADRGAYTAAIVGIEMLVKAQLPNAARLDALRTLAKCRAGLAIKQLGDLARAGKLPAGEMPKVLADAVTAYMTINGEFPTAATWKDLAALAERVRWFAPQIPWPPKVTTPRAPDVWAKTIALKVVRDKTDTVAVAQAINTITIIVNEYTKFLRRPARDIARNIHAELLSALSPADSAWTAGMLRQVDLLGTYATAAFADNVKAGRDEDNAKLSAHQNHMLAAMAKLVSRQVSSAPIVLQKLSVHLQPWLARGHWAAAEQAYTQLAATLPTAQKKQAELALVQVWHRHVTERHNMLLFAGLKVPRKLDPVHVKALKKCYLLQAGLNEGDEFLNQARGAWNGILGHYRNLDYWDITEQAIKTRPKTAVDAADAYAQLALANFHRNRALRKLHEFLAQYGAAEKITLTDEFKTAISGYIRFIADRPDSPLAAQAVSRVFSIARIFEQQRAYDVAVGVYRDFAAFAAKVKVLAQANPGAPSVVERAEYAAACAFFSKAQQALRKTLAAGKLRQRPPDKISAEFTTAIESYKAFVKARPKSALVGPAIRQIMSAATEYVRAGSWDVADAIYADLLASGLAVRRPERLEFCRGLCQLGKVMPDHAKQVLAALTTTGGPKPLSVAEDAEPITRIEEIQSRLSILPRSGVADEAAGNLQPGLGKTADEDLAESDMLAMATIRKHHESRAARIAMLRDNVKLSSARSSSRQNTDQKRKQQKLPRVPVLSEAEIARQEKAFSAAYKIFQEIRKKFSHTSTAEQARGEIMMMISHWRSIAQWQRAAKLDETFLADNPTDRDLPGLRLAIARDYLAWASQPVKKRPSTQEMLAEVATRFDKARGQLAEIVKAFPKEQSIVHQAQWAIANSFLTQARAVNAFSATLARGQFVRAAKELLRVAEKFQRHPNITSIPQMLWGISQELASRAYYREAVTVWNDLAVNYPTHPLAQQATQRVAQTYQSMGLPLRAAETYLELNFIRGGNDKGIQNAIFQIGNSLKRQKRWVEALHVLETFVDSFPRHANAGQALTMVGQIHQANEAWEDAITAYRRVIDEFPGGGWIPTAKWAIAESTINLSRWREAMAAYRYYASAYPKDPKASEANRRIGILKSLVRYQALVDEKGQRKAFDAQYQIAEIVQAKLSNPVKAIIEYRKVADNWANSHLADDAMFKVGTTYLYMGETEKARTALLAVARKYPGSPLADDAMYKVGQSYEQEAQRLASVTKESNDRLNWEGAQKRAYSRFQDVRQGLRDQSDKRIKELSKSGKGKKAEMEKARGAARESQYSMANAMLFARQAGAEVAALTAKQLAERQDKINAAMRKAVGAYLGAAAIAAADKADESLLRVAVIYADKLKDSDAAMKTYLEIVRQFSGTAVAEDASWRIAQYYERQGKYAEAVKAYKAFLRNYRSSTRAGAAQFATAEGYEHLGKWVEAMDAYTNYINNFPGGPMVPKAKEQITWIKTYRM